MKDKLINKNDIKSSADMFFYKAIVDLNSAIYLLKACVRIFWNNHEFAFISCAVELAYENKLNINKQGYTINRSFIAAQRHP